MSKHFVRSLFLGAVVACVSACGGAETEPRESEVVVDDVEQRACAMGTFQNNCRDWGAGGYSDPACTGGTYRWKFWACKQYQAGTQKYRQECGTEQYVCGSSATSRPSSSVSACVQNC
ncbi:hypothetical protein FJV41_38365 [Myxococcus llanfairpwllgwyngyllgogerychwyrndrobwllllantysiliogogogochensis]|uniref:Lipoprotein n=1 Tax=Myxococcus llanfairpwllgwyngyllgogerychwyrndrobwllllantysiliogogogochensis TaxID=2590453 RepID=A0A540WNN7_9BACT|nr:hypothetical protein [Myxococcus llanfairpwllgwyngyllgogerychwyrndrobwllllantysiliogogogochensis]TQF10635.1 hypothetical protein FJV41_38365 [Myxococcus llanfairpwllgwyngyllgogerychwyrndrobwllllantysiliogogogochensis]